MDEAQLFGRLQKVFEDVFDQDSIDLKPELSVGEIDGWDSLTYIRLVLTIEKEFGIKFGSTEMGGLETVGDFVSAINARVENKT